MFTTVNPEGEEAHIVNKKYHLLISGQPDIMDVTVKELFDFPAGVDVVHIGFPVIN